MHPISTGLRSFHHRRATRAALIVAAALTHGSAMAEPGDVLLIRRDLDVEPIRLVEINDDGLLYRSLAEGQRSGWSSIGYGDCLAFTTEGMERYDDAESLLVLADGQRLPGEINMTGNEDVIAWTHPRLGRLDVPLTRVRSLVIDRTIGAPPSGDEDVVALSNGDLLEGLVTAIGASVAIESTDGRTDPVAVPIERVRAVSLVTPQRAPTGQRVWLSDDTVIDVQQLRARDDGYVQLISSWSVSGTQPVQLEMGDLAAVLFDSDSLVPLATLPVSRIEGPATRYVLPEPKQLDETAPLGLSRLLYRGPIIVRYGLPIGTQRLAAEAVLPPTARRWGDYDLRILDDDREVFRAHLDADTPRATINVPLEGAELSIILESGDHGPIQDHLVLERAMVLVE